MLSRLQRGAQNTKQLPVALRPGLPGTPGSVHRHLSTTASSPTVLKSHSATSQSCPPDTSRSTPSLAAEGLDGDGLSGDAGLLAGLLRAAGAWCALRTRQHQTGVCNRLAAVLYLHSSKGHKNSAVKSVLGLNQS